MQGFDLINETSIGLVRNALLIAGEEMGETGDHWPVINATIHSVMRDFENLKIERNVHAEMKKQIYAQLDQMDKLLDSCTSAERADAEPKLKQMREIYDAHFAPTGKVVPMLSEADKPSHVRRAEFMISSLGDSHAE